MNNRIFWMIIWTKLTLVEAKKKCKGIQEKIMNGKNRDVDGNYDTSNAKKINSSKSYIIMVILN